MEDDRHKAAVMLAVGNAEQKKQAEDFIVGKAVQKLVEPLNCPFCGSGTVYFDSTGVSGQSVEMQGGWVECGSCQAQGSYVEATFDQVGTEWLYDEAVKKWNAVNR